MRISAQHPGRVSPPPDSGDVFVRTGINRRARFPFSETTQIGFDTLVTVLMDLSKFSHC